MRRRSRRPRACAYPRLSPDGKRVALDVRDQQNDIWIWDLARETLTRVTFDAGLDTWPVWTPDGRRIVFDSARAGAVSDDQARQRIGADFHTDESHRCTQAG